LGGRAFERASAHYERSFPTGMPEVLMSLSGDFFYETFFFRFIQATAYPQQLVIKMSIKVRSFIFVFRNLATLLIPEPSFFIKNSFQAFISSLLAKRVCDQKTD
jgi:hypothetical protein